MSKQPKILVQCQRTVHMYAELWHASGCVLDAGLAHPQGSSWQFLSSAVLAAFTFEAYLNHVGPTVIASWTELERLSPWAKFHLLCEVLKVQFPKGSGERPLQTIFKLLDFRNKMAHGRSQDLVSKPRVEYADKYSESKLGFKPLTDWEKLIENEHFATLARADVKIVCEKLHAARPEPKEPIFTFGMGVHSATLQPES